MRITDPEIKQAVAAKEARELEQLEMLSLSGYMRRDDYRRLKELREKAKQ